MRTLGPLLGISVAILLDSGLTGQVEYADLILRNGRVFTSSSSQPVSTAIGIRGERIVAVGSDASMGALIGPTTRVLDLGGRLVIPGINDAHDHVGGVPFGHVATTATPPMADPPLDEVMAAVSLTSSQAPAGEWIQAVVGLAALSDPAAPAALAKAAGRHPAILIAWWGHGALANPLALKSLHISEDVRDVPGGHYERDAAGRLTGKMDEYAAWGVLEQLHTQAGQSATVAYLHVYADRRLRDGVTSVQIMAGDQAPDAFVAALKQADLPLRLRVIRFLHPDSHGIGFDRWKNVPARVSPRLVVSGTKWVVDGTPLEQLAYQIQSYPGRPGWYGRMNFAPTFMTDRLKDALTSREPLALHVVGDAASEFVLTQMESLAPAERWRALRVRIEHGVSITGDRLQRAKSMGMVIGQPREDAPFRSWAAAGIPVAYGSDSGVRPFVALMQMVSPAEPNGVSRAEALRILTWGPAYAEFQEGQKGRLSEGMLADLAVLSQDVQTIPVQAIPATTSVLTLVGGKIAYDAHVVSSLRP